MLASNVSIFAHVADGMISSQFVDARIFTQEAAMAKRWARVMSAQDLGQFLTELRASRGLTQAQLADDLGISRRYVYEIESGKPSLYSDRLFSTLRLLGARLTIEAEVGDAVVDEAQVKDAGLDERG
jgi:HTH-type transcriptional regulator/antitoxin HipB